MYVFDEYEKLTGMRISYEKTTIYRIGSLKNSEAKFTSKRKVQWVNTPLNILGVYVTHDMEENFKLNYEPLIQKAKNLLAIWRLRDLTLLGKIQVLNSLVGSLFVYRMSVLPLMPKRYLDTLKKMFREFLWDGKKAKIKFEHICNTKENGGLGLVNLENRDKALKAQWLFKLLQDENTLKRFQSFHNYKVEITYLLSSSIASKDVDVLSPNLPWFWRDVMLSWSEVSYDCPLDKNETLDQNLWLNSNIRIGGKPIWNKKAYEAGMCTVRDIFDPQIHQLLTYDKVISKYGNCINFITYRGLTEALPQMWKINVKNKDIEVRSSITKHEGAIPKVKRLYQELCLQGVHLCQEYANVWDRKFGNIDVKKFVNYVNRMYLTTISTKLRSFHYRLLHGAIITNCHLKRYGIKETNLCTFCNREPETIDHLFWECAKVLSLWKWLTQNMSNFNPEKQSAILNVVRDNPKVVENCITLITKQYIYRVRCNNGELTTIGLRSAIKEFCVVEYEIAKSKNKIGIHRLKWKNVKFIE